MIHARIANLTAIDAIPTDIDYDAATGTVRVGSGSFGPVSQAVWDYTIGGKDVIRSWFNYRKANPTGRRTSPLDDINATTWPAEWNGEFIDLLSVLTRLVELHPAQEQLLDDILERPLAARADLAAAGVTWPQAASNDPQRRPNFTAAIVAGDSGSGQLGFTFGADPA